MRRESLSCPRISSWQEGSEERDTERAERLGEEPTCLINLIRVRKTLYSLIHTITVLQHPLQILTLNSTRHYSTTTCFLSEHTLPFFFPIFYPHSLVLSLIIWHQLTTASTATSTPLFQPLIPFEYCAWSETSMVTCFRLSRRHQSILLFTSLLFEFLKSFLGYPGLRSDHDISSFQTTLQRYTAIPGSIVDLLIQDDATPKIWSLPGSHHWTPCLTLIITKGSIIIGAIGILLLCCDRRFSTLDQVFDVLCSPKTDIPKIHSLIKHFAFDLSLF